MEAKTESEEILISTDKSKLNLDLIHHVLTDSYWSPGITKEKKGDPVGTQVNHFCRIPENNYPVRTELLKNTLKIKS